MPENNIEEMYPRKNGHIIIGKYNWEYNTERFTRYNYTLTIGSDEYFLKKRSYDKAIMNLIINELAKLVGFEVTNEDICKIDEQDTETMIISKDISKVDFDYVELTHVLNEYIGYATPDKKLSFEEFYSINNLENIWNALEYRYRNYKNKDIIVKKLMKQITKLFCFDVICGQVDRHGFNYLLEENDETASLAPLFDNENPFNAHSQHYQGIFVSDVQETNIFAEIKKYLEVSDSEFCKRFYSMFKTINAMTFLEAMKKVEEKIGLPIDRNYYLNKFLDYRSELEIFLDKETSYAR